MSIYKRRIYSIFRGWTSDGTLKFSEKAVETRTRKLHIPFNFYGFLKILKLMGMVFKTAVPFVVFRRLAVLV